MILLDVYRDNPLLVTLLFLFLWFSSIYTLLKISLHSKIAYKYLFAIFTGPVLLCCFLVSYQIGVLISEFLNPLSVNLVGNEFIDRISVFYLIFTSVLCFSTFSIIWFLFNGNPKYNLENFLLDFDFYKRKKILEAWCHSSIYMTDPKNPNYTENNRKVVDYKEKLFSDHLNTLSLTEKNGILNGKYISQSWERVEDATPIALQLKKELESLNFIHDVTIGNYHMDLLVLSVSLSRDPGKKMIINNIPFYYKGFMVKIWHKYKFS